MCEDTNWTYSFTAKYGDTHKHLFLLMMHVLLLIRQVGQLLQPNHAAAYKLWQKYKCEKHASNITLSYGVHAELPTNDHLTALSYQSLCWYLFYLMQNYAAFRR